MYCSRVIRATTGWLFERSSGRPRVGIMACETPDLDPNGDVVYLRPALALANPCSAGLEGVRLGLAV